MRSKIWMVGLFPFLVGGIRADQVLLNNGDRITGAIIKKEGTSLSVKSELMGVVSVPWEAVAHITSEGLLTVVSSDGRSFRGKIRGKDRKLEVSADQGFQEFPQAQIAAIRNAEEQKGWERLQKPGIFSLWSGFADLGISLAQGNAETTTVTADISAVRKTRTDKTSAYFHQIYATGKSAGGAPVTTARATRVGWAYNRDLVPRMFLNLFNDNEYDAFQNLDLRFALGGGAGYSLVKKENTAVDLLAGVNYSYEKFGIPLSRNSAEAFWGNQLSYKVSRITSLTQSFRIFHNLTETGFFRMNFETGTATSLSRFLSWQLTFSDRYLGNPMPGRKKNDVLLTTGLRFTFSR